MKLGCCVNMLAATSTKIGDENIPLFRELGYDYIEIPLAQIMDLSDMEFIKMYRKIQGIPVEVCNNFFPATLRLTGEEAILDKALEYARRATSRAAEMGVKIIVLGSAGAKNIPEGFPYAQAEAQFIALLRGIQGIVAPLDMTIVLEPLNALESNFILNASEGLAIMKEADCDNIRLLVDYYHMRMEDEGLDVIEKVGKNLRHVHIAAKSGRVFPKGNDGEDYEAFFDALKSAGYDARVSVEAFSKQILTDGTEAARVLRTFMG